ncbi:predicted protein [Histoplasma capsulatum G186AR]|uniref:Uncharacterized protein n=1 Tax=Ajellomyces capsulatus (strain G186AR / H82 / ATCC MYA-2454 / RMSCC 2432) TaxID=447093 RepID=C0P0H8_AJECG|nr:uncharacterized protein HCBG_08908 [Histoplasma capsulatum G186AR]EEH02798.1 predicted protein [Histoplasma capsulatum G186AR]
MKENGKVSREEIYPSYHASIGNKKAIPDFNLAVSYPHSLAFSPTRLGHYCYINRSGLGPEWIGGGCSSRSLGPRRKRASASTRLNFCLEGKEGQRKQLGAGLDYSLAGANQELYQVIDCAWN